MSKREFTEAITSAFEDAERQELDLYFDELADGDLDEDTDPIVQIRDPVPSEKVGPLFINGRRVEIETALIVRLASGRQFRLLWQELMTIGPAVLDPTKPIRFPEDEPPSSTLDKLGITEQEGEACDYSDPFGDPCKLVKGHSGGHDDGSGAR